MANQEEAKLLLELENELQDQNYDRLAEQEAQIGGRSLPTGLENEVAAVDNAEFGKDNHDVKRLVVSCKAVGPDDYKGTGFKMFYSFGPSYNKSGEKFREKHENVEAFMNDMKLMGFDPKEYSNISELTAGVLKACTSTKKKLRFLYGTSKKTNENGWPYVNVMGAAESDERPSRPTSSGKPDVPDFSVGDAVETTGDYFEDGLVYTGVIEEVGAGEATVRFDDDNSTDTVPFENLASISSQKAPAEASDEETSPFDFGVDDAVLCKEDYFGDGKQYEGRVTAIEGNVVTVEYEDGEVVDMAPEDLEMA